jgi:hypothetical protein
MCRLGSKVGIAAKALGIKIDFTKIFDKPWRKL